MKKLILYAMLLLFGSSVSAQTVLQTPSLPDSIWYTTTNGYRGINTAAFKGAGNIYALDYYDNSTTSVISVTDPAITTVTVSCYNRASVPDLIIGNYTAVTGDICSTCSSTSNDNILATAYVNTNGQVEIDYYDVYDDGSTTLSIGSSPVLTNTITGTYSPQTVHIDVIAETGNNGALGYPLCNNFMITWDDYSTPGSPLIWAAYGNLNTGTISTPTQITTGPDKGTTPDISAIKRSVGGPIHDLGLITYLGPTGNALYYVEWDYTATSISGITTLDNGSASSHIYKPRIDALDNKYINNGGAHANYSVVAEFYNPYLPIPDYEVRTYDNRQKRYRPSDIINISGITGHSLDTPLYNDHAPTVAFSKDTYGAPYDISVLHFMEYASGNDILFMEPFDYTNTVLIMGSPTYYWINGNSTPPQVIDGITCNFSNSVSSAPNDLTMPTIYAWAEYTGYDEVHYKLSVTGSSSFAFKHAPSNIPALNAPEHGWQVYPNPAMNELSINNEDKTNAATEYHITDVTGRIALQGILPANGKHIDVSKLAAGTYVINMYFSGTATGSALFVKQ